MKTVLFLVIVLFFSGCSQPPMNTANVSDVNKQSRIDVDATDRHVAIQTFLDLNYKGWSLNGTSGNGGCKPLTPCEIHLTKGSENKIITVILKRFHKSDNTEYWYVYEARPIDLAQAKIQNIKDTTLSELTIEDCQSVVDDIRAGVVSY